VDEKVTRDGTDYLFVDTAGIRRKSKTVLMAEKMSVVMARRHIRMAHVVLLVLDSTEGVVGLDSTIAGYAHEGGRALIICVNKWDQMKGQAGQKKREFETAVRDQFKFLDYAPIVFLSALTGAGVAPLFRLIREVYESASRRISTGELNRFLEHLHFEERKIFYITSTPSARPRSRCSPIAAARCTSRTSATWSTSSGADSVSAAPPSRSRREPRPKPRRGNGSAGGGAPDAGLCRRWGCADREKHRRQGGALWARRHGLRLPFPCPRL